MVNFLKRMMKRDTASRRGAALVLPLATFMVMYVAALGLYVCGMTVIRSRELADAADAASYAAAQVQAETLSRIATLNKALAWTYVQLSRRQMDWMAWKWLKHVSEHYMQDRESARLFANPLACPMHNRIKGAGWDISGIRFNRQTAPEMRVDSISSLDFSHLEGEIAEGVQMVEELGEAIDELAANLPARMVEAVEETLAGTIDGDLFESALYALTSAKEARMGLSDGGYLAPLSNTEEDESRFVSFAYGDGADAGELLGNGASGTGRWFVRGDERESEGVSRDGDTGLQRSYFHYAGLSGKGLRAGRLVAYWTWRSSFWVCYVDKCGYMHHDLQPLSPICAHGHHVHCQCKGSMDKTASVYGDNDMIYSRSTHSGPVCRPLVLDEGYFGERGTVAVALAAKSGLPLASILTDGGWIWALSAAKAGVRPTIEESRFGSNVAGGLERLYRVDWQGIEEWNLCESDWQGVLIPVAMAGAKASDGRWEGDFGGIAGKLADLPMVPIFGGGFGDRPDCDLFAGPSDDDGRWAVGNPGGRLDWSHLDSLIMH